MNTGMQIQEREEIEMAGAVDGDVREMALSLDAVELRPPCLISAETLKKAEYAAAFPQLMMGASVASDPDRDTEALFQRENLAQPDFFLSPAACYHAYSFLEGRTLDVPQTLTMRARCFRNEEREIVPGRRQVEFEMREIVLVGDEEWVAQKIDVVRAGVEQLASNWEMEATWETATDPFFMPRAGGKAHMQKLLGAKEELCLGDGLAVASINRHGRFFGERFSIADPSGAQAHTACIAFGLDRIQHQLKL